MSIYASLSTHFYDKDFEIVSLARYSEWGIVYYEVRFKSNAMDYLAASPCKGISLTLYRCIETSILYTFMPVV